MHIPLSSLTLERPKSVSLMWPSLDTSILSGFRSLNDWTEYKTQIILKCEINKKIHISWRCSHKSTCGWFHGDEGSLKHVPPLKCISLTCPHQNIRRCEEGISRLHQLGIPSPVHKHVQRQYTKVRKVTCHSLLSLIFYGGGGGDTHIPNTLLLLFGDSRRGVRQRDFCWGPMRLSLPSSDLPNFCHACQISSPPGEKVHS